MKIDAAGATILAAVAAGDVEPLRSLPGYTAAVSERVRRTADMLRRRDLMLHLGWTPEEIVGAILRDLTAGADPAA
ncbi:hypothetical protein OHA72_51070 [Dactylosporangium sp. NBC_01737]|uniref:hypothetical protein n=1 Tax=Dactylosporangium sp. NBC_01737 TaxID=2975959 RepID=UPI002E12AEB2|nr:hypothetical protein OHA72_51070 [Dactylosporangium sp. NBC_01737]